MTPHTELNRIFSRENPMKERDFIAPDLGNPFQNCGTPQPIEFVMTPAEQDAAKLVSLELERKRRAQNKRDADKAIASLGVVFTDGDAA